MYPKNSASPPRIAIGAVVQISDGAVQSSGVSVAVRPEGGSESAGGGTTSYGGSSNVVYYVPTQAETNYTAFVVTAYKTGCIPVSVTVITTESTVAGRVYVGTVATDAINAAALATDAVAEIQSGLSTLTQSQVTGGAYALNSASFAFNAALDFTTAQKAATLARVTLVDTTTTNTDMRGTDNAALAATALSTAQWTNTLATNLGTTNSTVATNLDATISSRLASASYTAAPSAATNASAVRTELTTELGRIDAAITSRMATYTQPTGFLDATFPPTVASTTNITAASGITISGTTTTLDALQTAQNSAHGEGSWATATGFAVAGDAMTLTSGERTSLAAVIWNSLTSGFLTVGSIGKRIVDYLTGDAYARIGAPVGASVSADIAAVKSDAAAIKTKTDQITFTVANAVDINVVSWMGYVATVDANNYPFIGSVNTKTGYALTSDYDAAKVAASASTASSILADTNELQTDWANGGRLDLLLDAILEDTGTTIPASIAEIPNAAANAAALLDLSNGIETSITPRQALRLILAAAAGKLSGAATTTVVIRNVGDTKDRITATVSGEGNRTAVSVDAT